MQKQAVCRSDSDSTLVRVPAPSTVPNATNNAEDKVVSAHGENGTLHLASLTGEDDLVQRREWKRRDSRQIIFFVGLASTPK
jgi:hypothetical protein